MAVNRGCRYGAAAATGQGPFRRRDHSRRQTASYGVKRRNKETRWWGEESVETDGCVAATVGMSTGVMALLLLLLLLRL